MLRVLCEIPSPFSGPCLNCFCVTLRVLMPSPDISVVEGRKKREKSFSFLLRSHLTRKLLFLHTWKPHLQLNAICFSGLLRLFRISRGHLCWENKRLSSKFLFSAYQAGVHFNIRKLIYFFPFLMLDMNY